MVLKTINLKFLKKNSKNRKFLKKNSKIFKKSKTFENFSKNWPVKQPDDVKSGLFRLKTCNRFTVIFFTLRDTAF